jgi:hypothetical protein
MVSRLVVVPSDGLSSPIAVAKAERGQSMKKNVNLSNVATVNPSPLNYPHSYFLPIDDGDEEIIKHYKRNGVPVVHIALPGRKKHYYAVFNGTTQTEADRMNRTFGAWDKKAYRDKKAQKENEISYDELAESGYETSDNYNNLEETVAYKIMLDALASVLNNLTEEELRICKMVANKEPQQKVAEELGIPRTTLRDRKNKIIKKLGIKLKDYK